ncbi:MAG: hypothetical protein Q8L48_23595 [Archangium sp.]|nr:hypothetical protein [Archangium sp.]
MNVTDSTRASSAAVLMVGGLAANVVLTLLSYAVNFLAPGSSVGAFPLIQELLWLGAVGVLVVGLFQLSGAVDEPVLLRATGVAFIVNSLVDLAATLLSPRMGLELGSFSQLLYGASTLLSLVARGLLLFCLVRLAMKTHAWVMPLLGTVALITLMRSAFSLASMAHLVPIDLYRNSVYRLAMPLLSLFNAVALVVSALAVKAAVAGAPSTPTLVAAAGLQPAPAEPVAPIADFLVGGILLAVGIGVTVVSLAAASEGGRYVVATGAIGVGLVRIVRGFIRLGRAG